MKRALLAILLVSSIGACSSNQIQALASANVPPSATSLPTRSSSASPVPTPPTASTSSAPPPSIPESKRAPAWHETDAMNSPRAFHTSTRLRDGTVLVAGGLVNDRLDGKVLTAAELYDPGTGTWTAIKGMVKARWGHTATLLPDGRVLVAGSYRQGGASLASAELFSPASGTWTATGSMTKGRGGHTATLLPDGTVLVVGGGAEDDEMEGGPRSNTAELYDPASGTWTATTAMIEARKGFSATLLPDGTVLVAGGNGDFTAAELYEPLSKKWTATGSMKDGRFGHTATLLPDGTVLATGGCACSDPGAWNTAEVYKPGAKAWTPTGKMRTARIFHTATLLTDGSVLVVNRGLDGDQPTSAELYDPPSGKWSTTAKPAVARFGYTATLLLDGQVLVTGDYDYESKASAELYDPGIGS